MTLHRFFVEPAEMAGDRFSLPVAIERQVRAVLRLRDGDRLVLLANDGTEAICRLEGGACAVEDRRPASGEPHHRLTVVQAMLKGDALEQVIQHGTEVGVAEFQLAVTDRSIVRELPPRRLERLRSIAREAAEQSERGRIPDVLAAVTLADTLAPGSVLLFERNEGERLGQLEPPSSIVIGPEGGFTRGVVLAAIAAGATVAGLGPRILRSETVAAVAAALILSRTGDFA